MSKQKELFTPIKRMRTFEEVSSKIKEQIFEGAIKPGDKLPSETQLAGQFKVGRQTIREALRLLERSGFITIQKGGGGGSYIKDTVLNKIADLFLDAFRLRKVSIDELTAARVEIERAVLSHVIENVSEADIENLQENVSKARGKIEQNNHATEENIQFHILLAEASKNHVFVIVVESIMALHGDFLSRLAPNVETSDKIVTYHEEILEALIKKDRNRVINIFEKHLVETGNRMQTLIKQEKSHE